YNLYEHWFYSQTGFYFCIAMDLELLNFSTLQVPSVQSMRQRLGLSYQML
ncbi:hypothetical protein STEG23_037692, partial [Scotinomys teguina]